LALLVVSLVGSWYFSRFLFLVSFLCGISPEFDGKEEEKQVEDDNGSQTQVDDPLRIHIFHADEFLFVKKKNFYAKAQSVLISHFN
jgi:hypothetical protein